MPCFKAIRNPERCTLLVAGLGLAALLLAAAVPADAHGQPGNVGKGQVHSRGASGIFGARLHLAKVIVLKNDPRETRGSSNDAYQPVAPRLQSRIRRNSEFAAFVKLVRTTSKRKFTTEELQKLYLSFKAWSYHNSSQGQ